jgi:cytochrome c553
VAEPRGLGADYIAEQLQNFKEGKRNNPVMMPNAVPLSPDDMADLGAYFDSLVNTGTGGGPVLLAGGRKALSRRRQSARHPGVHGLSRPDRRRQ